MSKVVQDWIQRAEYDLQTAKIMLNAGRYLYVAFMCQQAIEKILKAIYIQQKKEFAPRTHNLSYLVDSLELKISQADEDFLLKLTQYYIESRYPEEREKLSQILTQKQSQIYIQRTKEVFRCLREMLP